MRLRQIYVCGLISVLALSQLAHAADNADQWLSDMQHRWAVSQYQLAGTEQIAGFESLISHADAAVTAYPDAAELWVWKGIINSSYAGIIDGSLSALKYAKTGKSDLEKAMAIDKTVLNGSAYTSLGALYYKVPGWPIGFGNDKKAETLLKKALQLNPEGIDSNYFYGDYLLSKKRYQSAITYLEKAAQAAPRAGREIADEARHEEIALAIAQAQERLK